MTTVLFGAGATIPFVKCINSNDILQAIRRNKAWDNVIRKIPADIKVSRKYIKRYARRIIRRTRSECNFERIIEICDRVAGFYVKFCPEDSLLLKELSIIGYHIIQKDVKRRNSISLIPFIIREIIANYIIEGENKQKHIALDEYNQLNAAQKHFIDYISSISERVSLVNLNYDSVLFNSIVNDVDRGSLCFGFTHGFSRMENRGAMFDTDAFFASNRTLLFPHGSVLFNNLGGFDMSFIPNSSSADSHRWEGLLNGWPSNTSIGRVNDIFTDFNSFIVSGQTKEMSLNRHPYNQFYFKMITSLLESDLIITIGFSYQDEYISGLIKNKLRYSNSTKLVFVDYQDSVSSNLSLIKKFEDIFQMETVMDVDSDQKISYARDPRLTTISKEREGWLTESVYYYGKGYGVFLREFKDVFRRMGVDASVS